MLQLNSIIRRAGFTLLLSLQLSAFSQSNYTFVPSVETYSSITGTDVTSTLSNYTPINIGFTFKFDGIDYTQVVPSKNGWLSFNTAITTTMGNNAYNGNLINTNCRPLIGVLFTNNSTNGGSRARYTVTGTAPNRVFIFEWYNWQWHWYTTNVVSCEIKLYETSNKIECVYNPVSASSTFYCCTSIGLAFAKAGDYLSLSDFSTSPMASNTSESHNFETHPVSGLTYTFNPIAVKATPSNQCSNLSASIENDNITLNWTDATGSVLPDGYLVMASKTNSFTDPTDGSSITQDNDLSDGTGMVKVLPGQQSYTGWNNAESSTNYYFKIFSFSNGSSLTKYNKTSAPTAQIKYVKSPPTVHVTNFKVKNNAGNYEENWIDASKFGQSINLLGRYEDVSTYGPYLSCSNTSALDVTGNAITLEAWINPKQTIGDIFQKTNSTLTNGYRLYISPNGQICFGLYTGIWNEVKSSENAITINAWSYVCATYDGSTQKIYINGKLIASKSTSGNIATSTVDLSIGASPYTFKNYFVGKIDEISIWSIARSEAEVLSDMALNITGNETGLAVYFKCNNNNTDSSPNSIEFTLMNSGGSFQPSNTNANPDGYVLQVSSTNIFSNIVNGTDITTDNNLTDGLGDVKVAPGIQAFGTWTNIDESKPYNFRIIPFSNKSSEIAYNTIETIPLVSIKPKPTNHVTSFAASSTNGNIILNWTDAIGTQLPDGYVILVSTSPTITAPTLGTEITIDNNLSDGTGAVKVLNGVQTYSNWTNIVANTTYYFNIYPYTNSNEAINYKTDGTVPQTNGNIVIFQEPTNHASGFSATNNGTLTLNWSDAKGINSLSTNNALAFDGTSDYVSCDAQNPAIFTIEVWTNSSLVGADGAIVSTLNELTPAGMELHIGSNGKAAITIKNASGWIDVNSPDVIPTNTWVHLAASYDGTTIKLYVNGTLVTQQNNSSFNPGANLLCIGKRSVTSGGYYFKGIIDELRIWNVARTQTEIQSNYQNELTGTEANLVSYYPFNQGTANSNNPGVTTLTDKKSLHPGTLQTFALTGTSSNWVNSVQAPQYYLIKASTSNSFTDPVDGTELTIDNNLSDGTATIKVAQGAQAYSDFVGTTGSNTYYFKMWPYTNERNIIDYKTAATVPTTSIVFNKTKPLTHVTNLTASNDNKVITMSWNDATEGTPSFSNAISLDGTNDLISIPSLGSNLYQLTIETWINYSSTASAAGLFNTNSWVNKDVHLQIWSNNTIEFALCGSNPTSLSAPHTFSSNTWYHIAITYNYNSKQVKFYVNGTLIQTSTFTSAVLANLTVAQIGAWTNQRFFPGKMDEYRVWNTERTQTDIFNNMYSELTGSELGLIAYYKFNQGIASGDNSGLTTVTDATTNAKHGTLTNAALTGISSNWVYSGNLGKKITPPDGYLIKASKTNNITAPANGTAEADDNDLTDGTGAVNIPAGVQTYNGWINFTDTTAYYYKIYPYSNSGTSMVYNTSEPVPVVKDSVGIDEFKEITTGISGLVQGKARWADYDNNGNADLLLFGGSSFTSYGSINNCITKLYKQNPDHTFTENSVGFVNVADGDAAWGDYNNDGRLDLIISGVSSYLSNGEVSTFTTKLYLQNPDGSFTVQTSMPFENLHKGSVAWGDYDNDGDLDIIMTGLNGSTTNSFFAKVYRNNGDNSFTAQHQIIIDPIYDGSLDLGDYNKDGYLDILITGRSSQGRITKIYLNNKNNFFFEQKEINIPGIELGSAKWGDYDNDGDLDILIHGNISSEKSITNIYTNNWPDNSFTEVPNLGITPLREGASQWADINKDGKMDIVIGGLDHSNTTNYISQIYLQSDDKSFSLYTGTYFNAGGKCAVSLIDYDNDNDLDLFYTGHIYEYPSGGSSFSSLYRNNLELTVKNTKPAAPSSLADTSIYDYTTLSWDKVTTDNTPTSGLSYNIRLGTSSGACDVVSPMSDATVSSGYRRIPSIGNCQQNNFKVLKLPPGKTYYWSVQAVDNSNIGGDFSTESSFFVDSIPASGLTFSRVSDTEYKAKWTRGNGNRCAVFCRADSSTNNATPVMGQKYVHASSFTDGDAIPYTDWYCVYNGPSDSVVISRLPANTSFTVQVIEYMFDVSGNPKYFRVKSSDNDDWGIFNTSQYSILPQTEEDYFKGQWADFNNDGYLDFAMTNPSYDSNNFTIGINNGDNTFSNINPTYWWNQNILVADFDNDGSQEIFISAFTTQKPESNETNQYSAIYDFNNANPIKELSGIPVFEYNQDRSFLCDFNKDGFIDIVRKGLKRFRSDNDEFIQIFINDGNNNFIAGDIITELPQSINFDLTADYDNDGDVDLLGYHGIMQNNSTINTGAYSPNKRPSTPSNLSTQNIEGNVVLKWDSLLTDETLASQMTYDIRVRKVGDTEWFDSPLIDENGYRRAVTLGKIRTNSSILSLPLESYEWQVQAIDQGYQSSEWSALNTFTTTSFFTADTVCLGDSTSFIDHSAMVEGQATWLWDFGDNSYSNEKNPKHKFTTPGKHVVNLSVNSYTFSDTIIVNDTILVSFTATDVCSGLATSIKNTTPPSGFVKWQWDFGDNSLISTNGDIDSHSFPELGNYTVSLTAVDSKGCSAKAIKNVVVTTTPNSTLIRNYGNPSFCKGDSVIYSVQSNPIYNYQWIQNNQIIDEYSNSIKVKTESGKYKVLIENSLASTCSAMSEEIEITVKDIPAQPVINAESDKTSFCKGDSVTLSAGMQAGVTYHWYLNDGPLQTENNSLNTKEMGHYTLKISFENGCYSSSSLPVNITVNALPLLPSISYGNTNICSGQNITFAINSINPNYTYKWQKNSITIDGATAYSYSTGEAGEYNLLVENSNFCSVKTAPIAVVVKDMPVKPLIFAENNSTLFCPGSTSKLMVTDSIASYSYQWKRSGISIDGANQPNLKGKLSAGDYRIEAKNGDCAVESDILTLNTKPAPVKPTISARGPNVWILVCDNKTANIYKWYYNDQLIPTANTYQYVANKNLGDYKVEVNEGGECSTVSDIINIPTGNVANDIDELVGEIISISPNPSSGIFNVDLGAELIGSIDVQILDSKGALMLSQQLGNTSNFSINLGDYPNGIYLCKISHKGSSFVKKIVKLQ